MQRRFFSVALSAAFLLIIIGIGCTKLDTTTLGSDLVTVDNVNTFADTLAVDARQGIFDDSTTIHKNENHAIGVIDQDPLFGKTDARIYVQFKPTFYPFYFGNPGDTVRGFAGTGFDSAFICLSYKGAWGDTTSSTIGQEFEVRAITELDFKEKTDTIRKLNYIPTTNNVVYGSAIVKAADITKRIKILYGKDSVENQIRIPLTGQGAIFAAGLFNQDSTSIGSNTGFYQDSNFRTKSFGFEIRVKNATSGKTLFYVNLAEAKSRLEFHYFKKRNNIKDTVSQSFQMYSTAIGNSKASSSGNYIVRNYAGFPINNPDLNNVYLQTSPGTFASLKIPQLTGYANRIVHRAYLIVEQTPENPITDNIYTVPPFLYLDLKDTVFSVPQKYKPLYFDLSRAVPYNPDAKTATELFHPFPAANVDINTFGGNALKRFDPTGVPFYRYEINVTRYVQHIVTNGYKNYDLRLYAPFNYYYPQYAGTTFVIPYFNPIALGRVKVGSGLNAAHKMRLVVIYSKV